MSSQLKEANYFFQLKNTLYSTQTEDQIKQIRSFVGKYFTPKIA